MCRFLAGIGIRKAAAVLPLAFVLAGPLGGCVHHVHASHAPSVHGRGHGPPPHAPAHGHRHKRHRDDVELVFDGSLGVYLVVGHPDYYWHGDRYLRWASGRWSVSHRIDGGWAVISVDAVPAGLVSTQAKHHKKAKRHRKRGWPAKHDH